MSAAPVPGEREARLLQLTLAELGLAALSVVEEGLADPDEGVRSRATRVAAERLRPARLVELVASGESLARRASAMEALSLAGEAAVPALLGGLENENRGAVLFFLQTLGRIRCPDALEALRRLAQSPDPMLAQAALEGIGHQRDRESLPLLVRALGAEPWLAFTAIGALGELADPAAIPALVAVRVQEDYREAADAAIERIRSRSSLGDAHA